MKEKYKDISNYVIDIDSPQIIIEESKASYNNGYIRGSIINNTGNHLRNKCLQFDFYDSDGIYVGKKTKEIKIFNVDEKIKFNIEYSFKNVDKINITFIDQISETQTSNNKKFNIWDYFRNL